MKNKTTWLSLRVSEEELATVKEKASFAKLTLSEYVRLKCTQDESRPTIIVDCNLLANLLVQIKREGNNLNQLTRYVNTRGLDSPIQQPLSAALISVEETAQLLTDFLVDSRNHL